MWIASHRSIATTLSGELLSLTLATSLPTPY